MGLNIHVEAKPASMHTLARYLDDVTDRVDIASSAAHSAYMTAGDWQGRAGEGFQAVANRLRNEGSSVADAYRCGAKPSADMRTISRPCVGAWAMPATWPATPALT